MSSPKHQPSSAGSGSSSKGKRDSAPKQHSAAPSEDPKADAGKSGRVAFDARGNPTWEWQTSTGVYDRNVSTQRLKTLEATELSIADTQTLAKPEGLALDEPVRLPGDGMNPYNSGGLASKTEPKHLPKLHSHSMSAHKTHSSSKRAPTAPPKRAGAWQRIKAKLMRDTDEK